MKMRIFVAASVLCVCALIVVGQSRKRPSPSPSPVDQFSWENFEGVNWQKGPSLGDLGLDAQVKVPAGYVFAGATDTRTIMEANHNPVTGREMGFVAAAGEDWFAVFEFDDVGYVKDDDKDSLDENALLDSILAAAALGPNTAIFAAVRRLSPVTSRRWILARTSSPGGFTAVA